MNDFKMEILKQLEEGKITANEALAMLGQQKPKNEESFKKDTDDFAFSHDGRERQAGWVENLMGWVGDVVNDVTQGVSDLDISANFNDFVSGNYGHFKNILQFESSPISQSAKKIILTGKNAAVHVSGYEGNTVQIECAYDARREDVQVYFAEENGIYQLIYDEKIMRHLSIKCRLPKVLFEEVYISSKNDKVIVDGLVGNFVHLRTKNDVIQASSIKCKRLITESKNDSISIWDIHADEITVDTTNSKIIVEDILAGILRLKTTNGGIKTARVNAVQEFLSTTNAKIKYEANINSSESWDGERVFEASTTNGNIVYTVSSGESIKIKAFTINGKINCKCDNLNYSEFSKGYMSGESVDYGFSGKKKLVKLSTTNSTIKII